MLKLKVTCNKIYICKWINNTALFRRATSIWTLCSHYCAICVLTYHCFIAMILFKTTCKFLVYIIQLLHFCTVCVFLHVQDYWYEKLFFQFLEIFAYQKYFFFNLLTIVFSRKLFSNNNFFIILSNISFYRENLRIPFLHWPKSLHICAPISFAVRVKGLIVYIYLAVH